MFESSEDFVLSDQPMTKAIDPHLQEAWMLLSIVCPVVSSKDSGTADIVATQWLDNHDRMDQSNVRYALITLSSLAAHINEGCRERLLADLLGRLHSYAVPARHIKYMVVAVAEVSAVNIYCM